MVNTLSGSVCAYRKETVKPRFIRIDEVMALLDVTQDEAMDIALAAGARYQLAKIILVHKERLMKFMKHSARVPSSNKIVEKKFVRIGEGSMTYSIGHHRFIEMARAAGAVYKIGEAITPWKGGELWWEQVKKEISIRNAGLYLQKKSLKEN